jgi:hypothetical protein
MTIISTPNKTSRIRRVANLSTADEKAILDFLQGAVRVRCKDPPERLVRPSRFDGWRERRLA